MNVRIQPNTGTARRSLLGKSAIVTGSTSGIGLAVARALASQGINVLINGYGNPQEIGEACTDIEGEFGVRAIYSPADMSKPDQIVQIVRLAEQAFGALDILVNNAGIQHIAPIEDFPPEKWDQIIAINLSATFHAIRTAVPGMKAESPTNCLTKSLIPLGMPNNDIDGIQMSDDFLGQYSLP